MKTVVGLYDRIDQAQRVVAALVDAGFDRDNISLIARDLKGDYGRYVGTRGLNTDVDTNAPRDYNARLHDDNTMTTDTTTDNTDSVGDGTAAGAGIGAVLGGIGGLLLGLGTLVIPGIGPVLAAGPLVGALAGAGVGAVTGGVVGALVDLGIPEEHAQYYAEGVRRGGTLVVVRAADEMANRAADIMNNFDPVDIDKQAGIWRDNDNWTRFDETAEPLTHDRMEFNREEIPVTGDRDMVVDRDIDRTNDRDLNIPIVEEELRVGKREVQRGGVRVEKDVEEIPVDEDVNLRKEEIHVERKPVDRPVTDRDMEAFKEGTYEFTEKEEEPIVDKTARVVEEVHVNKDVDVEQQHIHDTVRKTKVDIDKLTDADFDRFAPRFQQHYNSAFANRGRDYSYYEPAYRFGYDLARNPRYRDYDWNRVEPEARRQWDQGGFNGEME